MDGKNCQSKDEASTALLEMLNKSETSDSNLIKDIMAGVTIPMIQYYEEKIEFLKIENLGLRKNIEELNEKLNNV